MEDRKRHMKHLLFQQHQRTWDHLSRGHAAWKIPLRPDVQRRAGKPPRVTESRFKLFQWVQRSPRSDLESVWLHMPDKRWKRHFPPDECSPAPTPALASAEGFMLILYILATCFAGSKSLSKDSIHQPLGPAHNFTRTGRSYSQAEKHTLLPKSFYEACSTSPVATSVSLTNQRRQLWSYRFSSKKKSSEEGHWLPAHPISPRVKGRPGTTRQLRADNLTSVTFLWGWPPGKTSLPSP